MSTVMRTDEQKQFEDELIDQIVSGNVPITKASVKTNLTFYYFKKKKSWFSSTEGYISKGVESLSVNVDTWRFSRIIGSLEFTAINEQKVKLGTFLIKFKQNKERAMFTKCMGILKNDN